MFTGLIEDIGRIARVDRRSDALVFVVEPSSLPTRELTLGESVAVSGVCLTVTSVDGGTFTVLAGAETLRRTALGDVRPGSRVNLERAMRLGDRLGGHMVSGHVDAMGTVTARRDRGANLEFDVRAPGDVLRYVVAKGSIAVDGISLTVNSVTEQIFSVALIPHTVEKTTLADKRSGSKVNLEVDVIGKYVEKLVAAHG